MDVDYDEQSLVREIEARYYGSGSHGKVIEVQVYLDEVRGDLVSGYIHYDWVNRLSDSYVEEGHESFNFCYNRRTKQFVG